MISISRPQLSKDIQLSYLCHWKEQKRNLVKQFGWKFYVLSLNGDRDESMLFFLDVWRTPRNERFISDCDHKLHIWVCGSFSGHCPPFLGHIFILFNAVFFGKKCIERRPYAHCSELVMGDRRQLCWQWWTLDQGSDYGEANMWNKEEARDWRRISLLNSFLEGVLLHLFPLDLGGQNLFLPNCINTGLLWVSDLFSVGGPSLMRVTHWFPRW